MKKFAAWLISLTLVCSLAACGSGPDRQPAIDAFNSASDSFQELADAINANPDAYSEDVVSSVSDMADVLIQHKKLLEDENSDLDEDKLNEMIEWYSSVEDWVKQAKKDLAIN